MTIKKDEVEIGFSPYQPVRLSIISEQKYRNLLEDLIEHDATLRETERLWSDNIFFKDQAKETKKIFDSIEKKLREMYIKAGWKDLGLSFHGRQENNDMQLDVSGYLFSDKNLEK